MIRVHSGWGALATVLALALTVFASGCSQESVIARGQEGCMITGCHQRVEHIHYGGAQLSCVDCHGGNPGAVTKEEAHPTVTVSFNAATPGASGPGGRVLEGATLAELDALDPDILQFLNPSDYRVVARTCGSATRGGGNCHARIVDHSVQSTHATLSGQIAGGLHFIGATDRNTAFGVRDHIDPYPVATHGMAPSLERLPTPLPGMSDDPIAQAYFPAISDQCVNCHLSRDGQHEPGMYTSSGCNACHMITNDDGRARTADQTQDRREGGHVALHRFTNLIPDTQCNRCHNAHLHRGLLFQGVRERSEPEGDALIGGPNRGHEDPPNVVYWAQDNYVRAGGEYNLYTKPFPFYISDEDGTNDVDETPPDIHAEKGMACIDCHTMGELHGGDHMAVRRDFETRVRCESCHGTPSTPIRPIDTPFEVAVSLAGGNGSNRRTIREATLDAGTPDAAVGRLTQFVQYGKLDHANHPVTQISERANPAEARFNPRTLMGCALHSGDAEIRARLLAMLTATDPRDVDRVFPGLPDSGTLPADLGSREGRLECFTCHNAWTVNCYGCHVVRDDRGTHLNQVTGRTEPGSFSNFAMTVLPDALSLGFNARRRVSPMVGTSIFFTHIDSAGTTLIDRAPLRTTDGFSGAGNQHNPVHHHTVRRLPRDCQGCHPRADGAADNTDALRRAVGYGTGQYTFTDGAGAVHILDQLVALDFDGDGVFEDPLVTPMGVTAVTARALSTSTHLPLHAGGLIPGALDLVTINRMLANPVLPQRP